MDEGDMAVCAIDAASEDAYWQQAHRRERYYSAQLDYEDYAPAYCVGYIGFAQYGGSFDDAEKSLVANWVRIKGDSRLPYGQACEAIRAAWDHAAAAGSSGLFHEAVEERGLRRVDAHASFA